MATKESRINSLAKREIAYKQAILGGDIGATRDLFDLYLKNGMYATAAELAQASYQLAVGHLKSPEPSHREKAILLFEYASDLGGHFESMCFLFDYYSYMGMKKDDPKPLKLAPNILKLAGIYQTLAKTDPERAVMHYHRAAALYDRARKLGSVDALYQLGQCYENSPDPLYDLAIQHYEMASQRDHIGAMYRLCELYLENMERVDPQKCSHLANKLYESAQFYQHIPGVDNQKQVMKLCEHASRLGHIEATEYIRSRKLPESSLANVVFRSKDLDSKRGKENTPVNILVTTTIGYLSPARTTPVVEPRITSIRPAIFGY